MAVAVVAFVALESGQSAAPVVLSASSSGSLLGSPLVVPGAGPLVGDQLGAAEMARRANPVAVAARERSRTAYAHLSPVRVGRLLAGAFPEVVQSTADGVPQLPKGAHIVGYRAANAVQVTLPGHRLGVVESIAPMAKRTSRGGYAPIDLSLKASGSGYAPARSDLAVDIPKQIAAGVSTPANGVSLTPVDSQGRALSGQGVVDRSSVIYPNTQPATDTLAKPTPTGFQVDDMLRSVGSPQQLYFNVGAPSNATLTQDPRTGVVHVQEGNTALATVPKPGAADAAGTTVPASMKIAGHTIVVTVAHTAGSYLYPIEVDPEVNDNQLATTGTGKATNWEFRTSNASRFSGKAVYEGAGKEHLETKGVAEYGATEWAYWGYETKGNSKIYELKAKTSAKNKSAKIESFLEFEAPGATEKPKKLLSTEGSEPEYSEKATTICAWNASKVEECLPAAGKEKNAVHFQQTATASPGGNYGFLDSMSEGVVSISEPTGTHSTTGYNTTSPELEFEIEKAIVKRKNALYGSGMWLSKFEGAIQMNSADAGIGVSATSLEYEKGVGSWTQLSRHEYLEKENGCKGVQCYPSHSEYWTLDPKLPNGEDKIRYRAEEAMPGTVSLESEGQATVKVDASAPHGLSLQGLPYGDELSERPYELSGEAIDGEGSSIASSGVKSLALYVDGTQFGTSGGSCSVAKGECTATRKWTINGAELGAGHHGIVLVVFDNAGNEKRLELTITIRHSTPVPIGPGSVDLQSGDFTLSSTDVSLGSGLEVNRSYSSRAVNGPVGAAFGPQWNIGVGTTDSLFELVDHSMLLTSANGGESIFASLGGTEYESPVGDSNLKLKLEENAKKEKIAYYLTDAAKNTSVKFTQPVHGSVWVSATQEGTVAGDTVTYSYGEKFEPLSKHPIASEGLAAGLTAGPNKEQAVWYTNFKGNKVGRMTTGGATTEYPVANASGPLEIAVGPDNNLWFTERTGTKIGKMTTSGVLTEYAVGGETLGIASGPDGNVWFTKAKKIGKITTSGAVTEYSLLKEANLTGLTVGPDGNLWFVEAGTSGKVGKITTSGVVTEYAVPANSEVTAIAAGPDGNIWFTRFDRTNNLGKIVKMTTSGTILGEYTEGENTIASWIVPGDEGNLWFSSTNGHRIGKIATSGAISEHLLPALSLAEEKIAIGPDENPWFTEAGGVSELDAVNGIVPEPTEVSAPKPAGVSCSPEMKPGCRSLKLSYTELSEYRPRLTKVALDAYNPSSKTMTETSVAQYEYDSSGRLIKSWDPRVGKQSAMSYGYDSEGHVTAVTPAGQESWGFTYGTIAGDAGTGRLLGIARAPASQSLWGGESVANTSLPAIGGTAATGVTMAISSGSWSGKPVAFGYQWRDCNSAGEECSAITGAVNANYVPVTTDVGHTLRVAVSATNGGGTVTALSAASAVVLQQNNVLPGGGIPRAISSHNGGEGYVWVADSTGAIEKIAMNGTITKYTVGEINSSVGAIAANHPETEMWFTNSYKNKIGKMTAEGVMTSYSLPAGSFPLGVAEGSDGNFWFTDFQSSKIGKITTSGTVTEYALPSGSEPEGIAVGPDGNLWFTDSQTSKIGKITTSGTVTEYALPSGSSPVSIAWGLDGNLWFTDSKTSKIGKITTSGTVTEYALPSGSEPEGITVDSNKNLSFTMTGTSKLGSITTAGAITEFALASKVHPQGIATGPDGRLWFAEPGRATVGRLPAGASSGATQTPSPQMTIEYGVSLNSSSGTEPPGPPGRPNMTATAVEKWGQTDIPAEATAIQPPDAHQGWPASSYTRATIYYLDSSGRLVNTSRPSTFSNGSISMTEYNETNDVVRALSPDDRQTALEAGSKSSEVAKSLSTYYSYREECSKESENKHEAEGTPGARLCDVEGPQHEIKYMAGKEQRESLGRLHTKYFYDESSLEGKTYNLQTKSSTLAELANEEEVEVRKTTTSYSGQSNLGWKLRAPTSVTVDPEGKKLTSTTLYNSTTGQITETRAPAGGAGGSSHDTKLIYYSAEANTEGYPTCGEHPEWAGLACETLPAKQPAIGPKLPVVVTTYNMFNEPLTVTETFGSTVRTKTMTYDEAGRLASSETTSTANTALPKVTNEYNATTGVLEKQSATVAGKTQTVSTAYNNLGQLAEYTDADGNITKYRYGGPESDYALEEVADGSNGGTGKQTFAYNATTKQLEELTDSAAGVFKASYDAEGKLVSEAYPNAMCANTQYNSTGEATHIEYIKTSNCTESGAPVWFSETRSPAVRGETFSRTSTLAGENYGYDTVGQIVETQETPSGEGCSVRLYGYDEESNRTSQTTRTPGTGGKCATEGGTVLGHSYDEGNHLADAGVEYDSFGNITKLPAGDAEGHELATSFYVDGAVAGQSQNGTTNSYYLDPAGRVRETVSGASAVVTHYDGPGQAVAWTGEAGGKSTRNIPGIDGSLAATQANGGEPVLQLHDLEGNMVATASMSTLATKVLSTYNSTEFGVPNAGKEPPKFAWLGAADVASSLPSGVITYGATSYVPQIGRSLQSEQVAPPGLPEGSGAGAAYTAQEEPWNMQGAAREGAEAPGLEAAREQAAAEAALDAVDPWHDEPMNRQRAEKLGEEFWEWEATAQVLSFYDLPSDFMDILGKYAGELVSQFGDAVAWAHDAGEKLIKCSKNQRPAKENICDFHVDENEVKLEFLGLGGTVKWPNFTVEPRVEECKYAGSLLICGYIVGITDKEI
jgi:streptogramin lyase